MSNWQIIYAIAAVRDMEDAIEYYEEISVELGDRFLQEVLHVVGSISSNPFFATTRYNEVRFVKINKFPYAIHYSIDQANREVFIDAVCSTWKRPRWED